MHEFLTIFFIVAIFATFATVLYKLLWLVLDEKEKNV